MELIVGGVVCLLAGLFMLLVSYGMVNDSRHRRSRGVVTEGVVVGSEWVRNAAGAHYQAPVVEFRGAGGQSQQFRQPSGTTAKPRVGRRVRVRYDPASPTSPPVVEGDGPSRLFPVVFGVAGLVAAVAGAAMLGGAAGLW
jgi:hypothetical protein